MESPASILVVEDEALVAMMIEDAIESLGHRMVGPVSRLARALETAESAEVDAAILDVNLAGERVFPVAEALRRREVPFLFLTGYGERGIEPEFRGEPLLAKPFSATALTEALVRLLGRRAG